MSKTQALKRTFLNPSQYQYQTQNQHVTSNSSPKCPNTGLEIDILKSNQSLSNNLQLACHKKMFNKCPHAGLEAENTKIIKKNKTRKIQHFQTLKPSQCSKTWSTKSCLLKNVRTTALKCIFKITWSINNKPKSICNNRPHLNSEHRARNGHSQFI